MEKVSYTKDELKFIDNCAHCLSKAVVFDSDVGAILTINGITDNPYGLTCKDYLFKLDLDEFDSIRFQFEQLLMESKRVKSRYSELINMFGCLRNNNR